MTVKRSHALSCGLIPKTRVPDRGAEKLKVGHGAEAQHRLSGRDSVQVTTFPNSAAGNAVESGAL